MDDIIHLLPDSVANQIAAGEVVQRPASIVKEMVENSIDAGADCIQVLVVDGGKTSVQVIDNGKGMSETDARLSFERHATSKIQKASDLFALTTMGFRGEALASIAAVAQIELKTRRPEDELGTCIYISGSKVDRQEPVACSVGCNFLVKNLFYNVPARRKFLKSTQTELSNIITDFERIVLVHPDISFTLYNNGTEIYKLDKASVKQRILDVFGKKINAELLPLEADTSLVSISGYVGKPENSKKKGARQFFFVNGRYMKHPYFHSAVMRAYENMIPVGEHVSYFIYLSVDSSSIDVNVHPTKTEIKFDNEQPIWQVLSAVVKETLGKFTNVPSIDFDVEDKPEIPVMGYGQYKPVQPKPSLNGYNPFKTETSVNFKRGVTGWEGLYDVVENEDPYPVDVSSNAKFEGMNQDRFTGADGVGLQAAHSDELGRTVISSGYNVASGNKLAQGFVETEHAPTQGGPVQKTIWEGVDNGDHDHSFGSIINFQYKGKYIVVPVKSGLMLVDQRRAHVRVLYERYMEAMNSHKGVTQRVLFPEVIQFSKNETIAMDEIYSDIQNIGFDLSNLGGGSYSILGVPVGIEGLNPVTLLHEMVVSALEKNGDVTTDSREKLALTLANSASIAYGQVLQNREMEQLLDDLFQTTTPMRTPDGKVVAVIVGLDYMEDLFK